MEDYRLLLGVSLTSVLTRPLLGLWAHIDKMYGHVVPVQLSLLVHLAFLLLLQSAWLQPVCKEMFVIRLRSFTNLSQM